ncbi:hypothetical protein [Lignipirellula cremea]|uniref:Uncharacterized protein n=1 Tax=Lignipirellula cremea TaxID=2528010 RepID=A0A518DU87_9BACT|nr:hypothetical protein [Lignipirellula cremea]QDU95394.1 hypothetical protein Pla8534_32090 [Lignipirellula cremea]
MFDALASLVFAIHLICMNVASAGPLGAAWLDWRGRRGDLAAAQTGRWLAGTAALCLLGGALAGLALGALVWDDAFHKALLAVRSRIFFGAWEIVFSLVLMVAQYASARWSRQPAGVGSCVFRSVLAVLASSNLLYHFPPLFAVVRQLAASGAPELPLTSAEFRAAMLTPGVWSLAVHFALASFAMVGLVVMLKLAFRKTPDAKDVNPAGNEMDPADKEAGDRLVAWGGRWALIPTLLQLPVGVWVLFQFPGRVQDRLTGGEPLLAALFGAAVFAALGLMHHLSAVAMGDASRKTTFLATGMMGLVVLLMAGLLRAIS